MRGGSMKRLLVPLLLVSLMVLGCATITIKDPAKAALYGAKSEWTAIREYVIRESYAVPPRLSDAQVADFKRLDDRFSLVYSIALSSYLGGIDNQVAFASNMDQIRDALLEARRKFLPGGEK
jgi:hypothetical protein